MNSHRNWQWAYRRLKALVDRNGPDVYSDRMALKGHLAKWCQSQHAAFRRNDLSASQLKLLLAIGFPLVQGQPVG